MTDLTLLQILQRKAAIRQDQLDRAQRLKAECPDDISLDDLEDYEFALMDQLEAIAREKEKSCG